MKPYLLVCLCVFLMMGCNQNGLWEGLEPTCPVKESQSWALAQVKSAEDFCLGGYIFELEDETKLQSVIGGIGAEPMIDTDELEEWMDTGEWIEIVFHRDSVLEHTLTLIDIHCAAPMAVPRHAEGYIQLTCARGLEAEEAK